MGSSAKDVADLMAALSLHVGEVERNPYHFRLPAWMMDNVRCGAELIAGRGSKAPEFAFATLYHLRRWPTFCIIIVVRMVRTPTVFVGSTLPFFDALNGHGNSNFIAAFLVYFSATATTTYQYDAEGNRWLSDENHTPTFFHMTLGKDACTNEKQPVCARSTLC
jgi:hypothetical protein